MNVDKPTPVEGRGEVVVVMARVRRCPRASKTDEE
jgi:hypothetical protein